MVRKIVILAFAAIAIVLLVGPSAASLIPMSWGFPVMVQNQTLSATNMDFATASDLETANIAFPTVATGILGTTFPTILQTADQSQTAMQLNTMDQTASTMFAYPWLSIGGSPVPSMGFL
jgi:O-acetyl-ADP-ribose deacetylase (regulator of RNase III)